MNKPMTKSLSKGAKNDECATDVNSCLCCVHHTIISSTTVIVI